MRKRYIVTILTALAVVAYLALDDHQAQVEIIAQDLIDQEPDYIIKGLVAQGFKDDGTVSQKITAATATHYPLNDITVLQTPFIILYEASLPKWHIRSDDGNLLKQQKIILNGNVNVEPANPEDKGFSLKTDSLDIDLTSQVADTDDPVIINSDSSELLATGMTILLDKQLVQFKSQVRGRHDPKAP